METDKSLDNFHFDMFIRLALKIKMFCLLTFLMRTSSPIMSTFLENLDGFYKE